MAKSMERFNKFEKEKVKQKKKQDKEKKKEERKANAATGGADSMIAYVDEYGNLTNTPPDPSKKIKVNAEDIEIGTPKNRNTEPVDTVKTGTVTFYNDAKGFGFIKVDNSQESIFTHVNSHQDKIKENDRVSFQVERGAKGFNAVNVKLLDKKA
ncbi:MAG: cold shock domain-containing protein [Bacteroidota bacterium]